MQTVLSILIAITVIVGGLTLFFKPEWGGRSLQVPTRAPSKNDLPNKIAGAIAILAGIGMIVHVMFVGE